MTEDQKREADKLKNSGRETALEHLCLHWETPTETHLLADAAQWGHHHPDEASGYAQLLRKVANAMDPGQPAAASELLRLYEMLPGTRGVSDAELVAMTVPFLRSLCAS